MTYSILRRGIGRSGFGPSLTERRAETDRLSTCTTLRLLPRQQDDAVNFRKQAERDFSIRKCPPSAFTCSSGSSTLLSALGHAAVHARSKTEACFGTMKGLLQILAF